jgi:hypothetical protein
MTTIKSLLITTMILLAGVSLGSSNASAASPKDGKFASTEQHLIEMAAKEAFIVDSPSDAVAVKATLYWVASYPGITPSEAQLKTAKSYFEKMVAEATDRLESDKALANEAHAMQTTKQAVKEGWIMRKKALEHALRKISPPLMAVR